MTGAPGVFSQSYAEARSRFLAEAERAGLSAAAEPHPWPGRDGEPLAIDAVLDGPANADRLLLLTSGCHGVEGFCGSAIQTRLLGDPGFRAACRSAGVSVLYLHALNPHGFSWWRRTTHENIDLNRNFVDFAAPLPANPGYDEIAELLIPQTWPPTDAVEQALARLIAERGMPTMQAAMSSGQHRHPTGLFFGGTEPSWSRLALTRLLQTHAGQCRQLAWIDVHTGLGPCGVGERIFAYRHDPQALARARRWWGAGVTSVDDGSSSSAPLSGLMWNVVDHCCPQATYTGIALEFGTWPLMQMMQALRGDQWLQCHPDAPATLRASIKQTLRDAFYVDTDAWKAQVLAQAVEAAHQAVAGLREA